jgi:hypothetical protein
VAVQRQAPAIFTAAACPRRGAPVPWARTGGSACPPARGDDVVKSKSVQNEDEPRAEDLTKQR